MIQQFITLLIGVLGGISVAIQTPLANSIGKRLGGASSSLVVHVSGAVFSGLLVLIRGGEGIRNVWTLPWWMFGAGLPGLILYLTINHTIPRIGATAAISLIIVGQLITGMVIDQLGVLDVTPRPIDGARLVAVALLLVGSYLMAK